MRAMGMIRRAKLRRKSLMRKVFESLENARQEEIEYLSKHVIKQIVLPIF
jgi:hypothetical protein